MAAAPPPLLAAAALLLLLCATAGTPADPPPAANPALVEQLYRLHELHKAGGLSDSEFAAAKRALLGTDQPNAAAPAPAAVSPHPPCFP